jgi:phosphoribosylanthranilate isomerase
MTKVKICGITNIDNARDIGNLGIDAIGLVFYDKSPRAIDIKTAQAIISVLPPFVNRVGLFVNAKKTFIEEVLKNVAIDTLQFHGDETPQQCECYDLPFMKAIRVDVQTDLNKVSNDYKNANGLLLDAKHESLYGGSGKTFDWALAKVKINLPIILAGGLTIENVKNAISQVQPFGVDVSSAVEKTKGFKDIVKVKAFMEEVNEL